MKNFIKRDLKKQKAFVLTSGDHTHFNETCFVINKPTFIVV